MGIGQLAIGFFRHMCHIAKRDPEKLQQYATSSIPVRLLHTRTCSQLAEAADKRRVQDM